jgi:hypothetical protein
MVRITTRDIKKDFLELLFMSYLLFLKRLSVEGERIELLRSCFHVDDQSDKRQVHGLRLLAGTGWLRSQRSLSIPLSGNGAVDFLKRGGKLPVFIKYCVSRITEDSPA